MWNKRVLNYFTRCNIEFLVIPWYGELSKDIPQLAFKKVTKVGQLAEVAFSTISNARLFFGALRFVPMSISNTYRILAMLTQAKQVAYNLRRQGWIDNGSTIYSSYCPTFRGLFAAYLKRLIPKSELVMHIHGAEVIECLQHYKSFMKYVLSQADKIVVASEYMKSRTSNLGIPETIIKVIPCGLEIDYKEGKRHKENLVMFCGRLDHSKDPLTLLESAPRAVDALNGQVKFIFVGEGILREEMEEFIRKKNLQDYVRILGQVANDKLVNYYKKAKVLVSASTREPFGIVLTEALSHYVPCIVTDIGGMPEIVTHGREGFIVAEGDADKIAQHILELFSNSDLYNRMSEAARKRSLDYDINVVMGRLSDFLNE